MNEYPSIFTIHNLTIQEVRAGSIMNELQTKVIQNRLAQVAEELVRVSCNRSDPDFWNKLTECQGRIKELEYTLELSKSLMDTSPISDEAE